MAQFTKKELAECAHRELGKRRDNYPKWVRERRMTQAVSDQQIAMMEAIYRLLVSLDDKEILSRQG